MIETERAESEARRKLIFDQNRMMNRPRPNRVIPAADRSEEILTAVGLRTSRDDGQINWASLTRE